MLTLNLPKSPVKVGFLLLASAVIALSTMSPVKADTFHIEQELTGLHSFAFLNQQDGTFYFNFQLTDGSQLGNGTTKINVQNFQLVGATMSNLLPPLGGQQATFRVRSNYGIRTPTLPDSPTMRRHFRCP